MKLAKFHAPVVERPPNRELHKRSVTPAAWLRFQPARQGGDLAIGWPSVTFYRCSGMILVALAESDDLGGGKECEGALGSLVEVVSVLLYSLALIP